jgi:hypothetical protein
MGKRQQWQQDPEVEALRREVRRRRWYMPLWISGFPLPIAAVVTILILTGVLH